MPQRRRKPAARRVARALRIARAIPGVAVRRCQFGVHGGGRTAAPRGMVRGGPPSDKPDDGRRWPGAPGPPRSGRAERSALRAERGGGRRRADVLAVARRLLVDGVGGDAVGPRPTRDRVGDAVAGEVRVVARAGAEVSAPGPPASRSLPSLPTSTSLPRPPLMKSLPSAPSRRSAPPLPKSTSLPAGPGRTPAVPAGATPTIVLFEVVAPQDVVAVGAHERADVAVDDVPLGAAGRPARRGLSPCSGRVAVTPFVPRSTMLSPGLLDRGVGERVRARRRRRSRRCRGRRRSCRCPGCRGSPCGPRPRCCGRRRSMSSPSPPPIDPRSPPTIGVVAPAAEDRVGARGRLDDPVAGAHRGGAHDGVGRRCCRSGSRCRWSRSRSGCRRG